MLSNFFYVFAPVFFIVYFPVFYIKRTFNKDYIFGFVPHIFIGFLFLALIANDIYIVYKILSTNTYVFETFLATIISVIFTFIVLFDFKIEMSGKDEE